MKHAYLILAHNEFPILKLLIKALDDKRNDIFVHFDKKVKVLPELQAEKANLKVIDERIAVEWGDVSVIEAEYALFRCALESGPYRYYHLLSGVDMALRRQNDIHDFFERHNGKEFIGFSSGDLDSQIERKVRRYHLFAKNFRDEGFSFKRISRFAFLKLQDTFAIRRNQGIEFKKGTQWVSVTHSFLKYVVDAKPEVLRTYRYTFCPDEIFIQTLCWNSPFRRDVFDLDNEARGCQRKIGWNNNRLEEWTDKDYDELVKSDALFARKFSSAHIGVVQRLLKQVSNN